MARTLCIACLQTRPRSDFNAAIDDAVSLASEAVQGGATLLALPEYCGGLTTAGRAVEPPAAVEERHPVLAALREFAENHEVWLLIGSIAIADSAGKIRNRSFLIDPRGEIAARYDKIHMFDIQLSASEIYRESDTVNAGNQLTICETPWGRLGHSICYDLRFPHLYRDLAQAGAEILAVPAAFTKRTGEVHWHVLNRARAIENGAFVIAPCAVGAVPGGGECYGHSLIVDPWGSVIADGGEDRGLILATVDLDQVTEARRRIPSLSHDRPYGGVLGQAPGAQLSGGAASAHLRSQ